MIDSIFSLINFLMVVGILGYVIKNYFEPWLAQEMAHMRDTRESLLLSMHEMTVIQNSLELQVVQEQERYQQLRERFARWRELEHNKSLKNQENILESLKIATARRRIQQHNFNELMLFEAIKYKIIVDTRSQLKNYYKTGEHWKLYMHSAFENMKGVHSE